MRPPGLATGTALLAGAILAAAAPPARAASSRPDSTCWQQELRYTIDVTVDDRGHNLDGRETVAYTNRSPDTLRVLWFHLYPNAFRSTRSTFMRDRFATYNWALAGLPEAYRHWMDVGAITVDDVPVEGRVDDTLLSIDLPAPLPPGGTARVAMRFRSHLGRVVARAGARRRHMDVAQWYPKPVVYDERGWHLDQYRSRGEFYGEFGTFDVTFTIPRDQVIAATGVPVAGDPGWDAARRRVTSRPGVVMEDTLVIRADTSAADVDAADTDAADAGAADTSAAPAGPMKVVTFHAERVHDFAWVCDPTFALQDTTVASTHVLSFFRSWNTSWRDSSLAHGVRALHWLGRLVGPYPYPAVSVVDALRSGGMEYPMLVMNGRADEGLVLHEIGHIYFYGILADNELDEAWLDEGFTTWQTTHYLTGRFGPRGQPAPRDWYRKRLPALNAWDRNALELIDLQRAGYWEPVSTPAWAFRNNYSSMVYGKGSRFLEALRYVLGDSTFTVVLREYYARWQFRHVDEARFRAVCEDVAQHDLGWLFHEWLHTTDAVDYRLRRTGDRLEPVAEGRARMPLRIVRRYGNGRRDAVPVPVAGLPDASAPSGAPAHEAPAPDVPAVAAPHVVSATINPANEILDVDMLDNSWPSPPAEYHFDWPFWSYRPPRRYLVATRPSLAWDTVGGVAPGWRVRTSYLGDTWAGHVTLWYAMRAKELMGRVAFSTPFPAVGPRATLATAAEHLGGRSRVAAELSRTIRRAILRPPDVRWAVGGELWSVDDTRYAPDWSRGGVAALRLGGGVAPRADVLAIDAQAAVTVGRFAPAGLPAREPGVFTRTFASVVVRSESPWESRVTFALRLAGGYAGGTVPSQQLFRLAGNPPLVAWRDPLARSRGTVPEDLHYHIGGDADLRGYVGANPAVSRFVALNATVGPTRTPQPPLLRRVVRTSAYVFGDVAGARLSDAALDRRAAVVAADAGVGAAFSHAVGAGAVRVRIDLPLVVSHPDIADAAPRRALAVRWAVGLGEPF